jgi:hypothetical protein
MMVAALDLVTHDDAQPTSSAVHLKGHTSLTYAARMGAWPARSAN